MESFELAFQKLMQTEGAEYTNRPADHGGPTKFGITIPALTDHLGRLATAEDIQALNFQDARMFYFKMFWEKMQLDKMPDSRIAGLLFDQAVNRGRATAIKQAQEVLITMGYKIGLADGGIGPATLGALSEVDARRFMLGFVKSSQESYVKLCQKNPDQLVFMLGWIRRTHALLDDIIK